MLPLTKAYAYKKLQEIRGLEKKIRKRLKITLTPTDEVTPYTSDIFFLGTEKDKQARILTDAAVRNYQIGNYKKAVELFKEAINIHRGFYYTYLMYAIVERKEGNLGKAEMLFKRSLDLNSKNISTWFEYAMMKKEAGELRQAERILIKGIKECEKEEVDLNILQNIAQIRFAIGKQKDAKNFLIGNISDDISDERTMSKNTKIIAELLRLYYNYGKELHEESKNRKGRWKSSRERILEAYKEAENIFEEYKNKINTTDEQIDRWIREVYIGIGLTYKTLGKIKHARKYLEKALYRNPKTKRQKYKNEFINKELKRLSA